MSIRHIDDRIDTRPRRERRRNLRKGARAIIEQTPRRLDQERGRIAAQSNANKRR